jgi:hypothetical protein
MSTGVTATTYNPHCQSPLEASSSVAVPRGGGAGSVGRDGRSRQMGDPSPHRGCCPQVEGQTPQQCTGVGNCGWVTVSASMPSKGPVEAAAPALPLIVARLSQVAAPGIRRSRSEIKMGLHNTVGHQNFPFGTAWDPTDENIVCIPRQNPIQSSASSRGERVSLRCDVWEVGV